MRRRSRQRARQPPVQQLPTPSLGATNMLPGLRRPSTARSNSSSPSPPRSSSRGSHSSGASGSSGSRRRRATRALTPRRPTTSPNARFRSGNSVGGANTAARALARAQAAASSAGVTTPNRNTRTGSRRAGSSRQRRLATPRISSNLSVEVETTRPVTRTRRRAATAAATPGSPSRNSILVPNNGPRVKTAKKKPRSKSHVSFVLPESSAKTVMTSDKYLSKILSYLNWNELNSARSVSKQWLQLVSSDPNLQSSSGVITINKNISDVFKVFNASLTVWTQFRLNTNTVFDLTQPVQSEFWWKHGATMQYLEIRNNSLTLSSLVEILSRTTNLIHLLVTWTAEMYSFNSELIRKYYGIHFRNGTFSKLQNLTIERSSFLTDNALWSILKWCGSALNSLTLSCGQQDEKDDNLSRLKPRWTLEPVENFANRFGYSGNFKFLDFTGSSLLAVDLVRLAEMEKLTHLLGLRLSHCKINDESLIAFLVKKGGKLEELYLDYTPVSDFPFNVKEHKEIKLGRLRVLNISGTKNFRNFGFISELGSLEAFYCSDTPWLTTNMITKPLEQQQIGAVRSLKKLDLSSNEKLSSKNVDLNLCHIWFIHFTTVVSKLSELDLSQWTQFGNDTNFKAICNNMPQLRKLRLRNWKDLTDEGVTGVTYQELAEFEEIRKDVWRTIESHTKSRPLIGKLKHLELLDLARCGLLSDMSIQFGILFLPNLRALNLSGSQVSDAGIHVLIAKSKTLDKLSLLGCERITPKGRRVHRLDGRAVFFGIV